MRQPSLFEWSPRFASRLTTVAAVAGLAAFAYSPAQAQAIGGLGQRPANNSNAPQQSAPVVTQRPIYAPTPQPRQSYPQSQPVYPQGQPGYSAPVFHAPTRIFRPNPTQGAPSPSYPPQAYPESSQSFPSLPPSITYHNRPILPGVSAPSSRQESPRLYTNQMPSTVFPRRRSVGPGALEANDRSPVFGENQERSIRITTPVGQRQFRERHYDNDYLYSPVTIVGGPSLLGGYYYGNYTNTYYGNSYCYPSVYSTYYGFPQYIYNPGVIVIGAPYYPVYATSYQPFYPPVYQVTYNQNNYYVASEARARQIEDGGEMAQRAVLNAYPAGSFQAAFADIQKAWQNSDIGLLRKHTRDSDTKLSIYFKGKYTYSIASSDFMQITRDAFDRLDTVSFEFNRLRKAKNGDVTAYGKHVYRTTGSSNAAGDGAGTDDTVPFSADGSPSSDGLQPYQRADDPAAGERKTIYVSYTLRRHDDQWYIIGVDSSPDDLVK